MRSKQLMISLIKPIILGLIIGAVPFGVHITGYGSYWRYGWLIFALLISPIVIVFIIFRIKAFRKKTLSLSLCILSILFVILFPIGTTFVGDQARKFHSRRVCLASEPILEALQQYKIGRGQYPESLEAIPNIKSILGNVGISIQQGEILENGISVENINNADATIYLMPDDFYCVVPIQKRIPISFTRFTIYSRNSKNTEWKCDSIIGITHVKK